MAESVDAIVLQFKKVFQLVVEGIAQGSQVEEVFADFFGNYLPAVFAHLSFYMGVHILCAIFERVHRGVLFFIGNNRDTAAVSDGFNHTAIDSGSRFLVFGQAVENAAMAD